MIKHAGLLAWAILAAAGAFQATEPSVPKHAAGRPKFKLKGLRDVEAGTAFVAQADDAGPALLFTALHLLGTSGGLDEDIPAAKLDDVVDHVRLETMDRGRTLGTARGSRIKTGFRVTNRYDPSGDVAAFTLDAGASAPTLRLARANPKIGDPVWAIGEEYDSAAPQLRLWPAKVSDVSVRSIVVVFSKKVELQGFSGAPVVDAAGDVVGIVCAGLGPGVYLTPVANIRDHLKKNGVSSTPPAAAGPAEPEPAGPRKKPPGEDVERSSDEMNKIFIGAKLKTAKVYIESGKLREAREILEDILKNYGKYQEAEEAKSLLEKLKK